MDDKITVNGLEIRYKYISDNDYISLTDLAKFKTQEPSVVIANWMRTRNTIDYL
jgi:hypothetical protein